MSTILIEVDADDRKLKRALKNLEGPAKREGSRAGESFNAGFTSQLSKIGKNIGDSLRGSVSQIAIGNIIADQVTQAIDAIKRLPGEAINQFREFEQAQVGVQKTTGITGTELQNLSERIKDLAENTPVAAEELLAIGQSAGQLGVTGSENILKFVDTISKLGFATDVSGEDAAKSLTRILNVTSESVGTIDKLGSVVVRLGNNFAATESEIIRVTNEVARSTGQFGVTSAQATALGAALKSLGVRAEGGGTAVGKAFRVINESIRNGGKQLEALINLTGKSGDELRKVFAEDATEAFRLFVQGVGRADDASAALERFGLNTDRASKVIPPLASNIDELNRALALANDELVNTSALNDEAAQAFDTLNGDAQRLANVLENVKVSIVQSLAPAIRLGTQLITDFFRSTTRTDIQNFARIILDIGQAVNIGLVLPFESAFDVVNTVVKGITTAIFALATQILKVVEAGAQLATTFGVGSKLEKQLENTRVFFGEVTKSMGQDAAQTFGEIGQSSVRLAAKISELRAQIGSAGERPDSGIGESEESNGLEVVTGENVQSQNTLLDAMTLSLKTKTEEMRSIAATNGKKISQALNSAVAQGISRTIQNLAVSLAQGTFTFEGFAKSLLGILGDMAVQIGQVAIAAGLAMTALFNLSGPQAIAAGAALVAIGSILKSISGSGGIGASSPNGGGVQPVGGGGFSNEPVSQSFEEEDREANQSVQLVVQGDILDSEDTGKRLVKILNDNFENEGSALINGRFA